MFLSQNVFSFTGRYLPVPLAILLKDCDVFGLANHGFNLPRM